MVHFNALQKLPATQIFFPFFLMLSTNAANFFSSLSRGPAGLSPRAGSALVCRPERARRREPGEDPRSLSRRTSSFFSPLGRARARAGQPRKPGEESETSSEETCSGACPVPGDYLNAAKTQQLVALVTSSMYNPVSIWRAVAAG